MHLTSFSCIVCEAVYVAGAHLYKKESVAYLIQLKRRHWIAGCISHSVSLCMYLINSQKTITDTGSKRVQLILNRERRWGNEMKMLVINEGGELNYSLVYECPTNCLSIIKDSSNKVQNMLGYTENIQRETILKLHAIYYISCISKSTHSHDSSCDKSNLFHSMHNLNSLRNMSKILVSQFSWHLNSDATLYHSRYIAFLTAYQFPTMVFLKIEYCVLFSVLLDLHVWQLDGLQYPRQFQDFRKRH